MTLTGDGYNLINLKKIAEDLNILKFVNFVGWVDVSTAIELLNNSDYFVHHSITSSNGDTEGLPTSIIEAMAMDMPVISTYHAGIPELVEHNVNGYLVKEKDVKSFANYMEQITSWDYIPENRKKVEKHFSKDSHFKKLSKLYKKSVYY